MASENSENAPSVQVTVSRDAADDVQVRQIAVFLDGQRVTELLFGESRAFPVSPGRHVLKVHNTWNSKEIAIEAKAGESLFFRTKSTAGQFSRFLLVAFGAGPIYVSIEQVFG